MTLTLPKLLLLAVIAWLVWTFLRKQKVVGGSDKSTDSAPRNDRANQRAVEDMVKCPKCGAYVPSKGTHDCPGA